MTGYYIDLKRISIDNYHYWFHLGEAQAIR